MIHFESINILSHPLIKVYYIFNCLCFTSFEWFNDMTTIEDHKILMRDRCNKCGDLRIFFLPPLMEPLAFSSAFVSLTIVCDLFLLMVFMLYVIWVPFQIFILVWIYIYYLVPFRLGFILVSALVICFFVS